MKLACVVQRYGAGVAGGSERHCRELALRLAARHDVTVLTTCAADYVTWDNEFPAGESVDGPLRVRRFPVSRPRRLKRFAELSDEVFDGRAPEAQQEDWFRENGPDCPALLDYLRAEGARFDLVLFWTFRYAPSFFGVPLVRDRAVLLPTAEEDRAVDLSILEGFFQMPAAYLFLTPEEETLVSTRAGRPLQPSAVIGMGLDAAPPAVTPAPARATRICCTSGASIATRAATPCSSTSPSTPRSTRGRRWCWPGRPRCRCRRIRACARSAASATTSATRCCSRALALVVPSPFESLSIVLLEGWNRGVPAIVNARCAVLKGQVRRANGGLYYRSAAEFAEAVETLRASEPERRALGAQGLAYVEREYRWPTVMERVERLLDDALAVRRAGPRA